MYANTRYAQTRARGSKLAYGNLLIWIAIPEGEGDGRGMFLTQIVVSNLT